MVLVVENNMEIITDSKEKYSFIALYTSKESELFPLRES